ncbi:MAG: Gfo/Idh/MocA family oxidoreductase [Leptolyngbyaceae cyanobacterium RM2_2_4]|nr:Gfo/Idh/MocA family oxidoreductase [Leptolyngbyaceae cyanobacterium SM1_4_3]NJN90885.1 Gfo/Idh/MocA family oxidoreductase [Leptolyngbyaceae cyanobacterium SL_5_14]NJO50588.1 Gfo/Idh/MocA family oxidoreductase [Leptolyngbyaceae cyanobacterium RM2_2_4]
MSKPIRVGLVGTGYAAKLRAEALQTDPRSHLITVAGHTPEKAVAFSQTYATETSSSWIELVQREDLDLIIIATVNRDHGAIARAALQAGKHVVVEYPLSLNYAEAEELVELAQAKGKLLHVEHIELLSGVHQAIVDALPAIGSVFYVRYANLNPQRPAPQKWTYQPDLFGFPLIGALSRVHRLTDLFGQVDSVNCNARFWNTDLPDYYTTCLCTAQLQFQNGVVADLTYGKGEVLWKSERSLEIHGEKGALLFEGDRGTLVQPDTTHPLEVGSRKGLFAKDTAAVLDHLTSGSPLYVTSTASLYALKIADAARRSAETGCSTRFADLSPRNCS